MRQPYEYESPGCREVGGDWWFPDKDGTAGTLEFKIAMSICGSCVHKQECAEWGINNERFGIWGGLTERQLSNARSRRGIKLGGEGVARLGESLG